MDTLPRGRIGEVMRIVVFSDTHGDITLCERVLNSLVGVDMVLHAGDHARDAEHLAARFPSIPVKFVRGNCDLSGAPAELILETAGKRIFMTHGHLYNVKNELAYETLAEKVREAHCDLGIFGHTHLGYDANLGRFSLLNPGSIRYCATYGVVEIEDGVLRTAVLSCG